MSCVSRVLFDFDPPTGAEDHAEFKRLLSDVTLSFADCSRKDRMDTQGAERIATVEVERLLELMDKRDCSERTLGTRMFLRIMRSFTATFFDPTLSAGESIVEASYCFHFLSLWMVDVEKKKQYTAKNFITSETYRDVAMSVHYFVITLVACRELYDEDREVYAELLKEKMGTDVVEKVFGLIAQYRNNTRATNFSGLLETISKLTRVIEINAEAPHVGTGSSEKSRHRDFYANMMLGKKKRSLSNIHDLTNEKIIGYWEAGEKRALGDAKEVGIGEYDLANEKPFTAFWKKLGSKKWDPQYRASDRHRREEQESTPDDMKEDAPEEPRGHAAVEEEYEAKIHDNPNGEEGDEDSDDEEGSEEMRDEESEVDSGRPRPFVASAVVPVAATVVTAAPAGSMERVYVPNAHNLIKAEMKKRSAHLHEKPSDDRNVRYKAPKSALTSRLALNLQGSIANGKVIAAVFKFPGRGGKYCIYYGHVLHVRSGGKREVLPVMIDGELLDTKKTLMTTAVWFHQFDTTSPMYGSVAGNDPMEQIVSLQPSRLQRGTDKPEMILFDDPLGLFVDDDEPEPSGEVEEEK